MDSTPLQVKGFFGGVTRKVKLSLSKSQHAPWDLCAGNASSVRPRSLISFALSLVEKACITSTEFDATLCRCRLALARVACVSRTKLIAWLAKALKLSHRPHRSYDIQSS